MSLHPSHISREAFDSTLTRYPALLKRISAAKSARGKGKATAPGESLAELDEWRLQVIPGIVRTRREDQARGNGPLEKEDIEKLVKWKLKHGTFRPSLLGLVQSNDDALVSLSTSRAAACLDRTGVPRRSQILQALRELIALKGIGPATATLLLSVILPAEVPFFSDEAFRWLTAAGDGSPWDKKIKYTLDEYAEMWDASDALCKRLGVGASEVERVGYVLGQEGASLADVAPSGKKDAAEAAGGKPAETDETPTLVNGDSTVKAATGASKKRKSEAGPAATGKAEGSTSDKRTTRSSGKR